MAKKKTQDDEFVETDFDDDVSSFDTTSEESIVDSVIRDHNEASNSDAEETPTESTDIVSGNFKQVSAPDISYLSKMDEMINKMNKDFQTSMKGIEDNIILTEDEDTPIIHTGNPCLDVYIGGGIPQRRMTYLWGSSGTGKTSLAFQIGSSLYRHLYFTNKTKDWVYAFIDAEEGESKKWLDRIGLRLPYGKPIIPSTIEDIKPILENLSKKHKGKEIFVIWDSIASTKPKNITGRGDTARSVSALFRDIKFNDLGITMLVINQFREKTDQYKPPEPPGGNHPMHKSHFTLYTKSYSKSKFFTKNPKFGRSVLCKTQKARDSFNDIEFRMEMTYHSGFDAILGFISALKDFGIYEKKNGPFKLKIDKEFNLVWKDDKVIIEEKTYKLEDLIDHKFEEELRFDKIKDIYNFLLVPESYPYWNLGLRLLINQTFKQYFIQDDKFMIFNNNLHNHIMNHYFVNNMFDKLLPTRLIFS